MTFLGLTLFLMCFITSFGDEIDRSNVDVNKIPDENKLTVDFVKKYGYPAELHEVLTKDGYYLLIHRIPHNGTNQNENRPVVLLQHGIVLSSDQWVLRGTDDLVFLLSNQGYDVWMSNTRGTIYSKNRRYTKADYLFWDYSIDDLGNQDLSAIIDYVLNKTGKPNLTYIGHSRGVAMAVILLSSQPEYNSKINLFLGIAPVIYSKEAKCPIYLFAGNRPTAVMSTETLRKIFETTRLKTLLSTTKEMRFVIHSFCNPGALLDNVCPYLSFFINGDDFQMFNKTLLPLMISHFTLGVSAKELMHLLQISESDVFRAYDYGRYRNILLYGREEPAPYNISKVTVPTFLYYGPNDFFVSERDFFKFAVQLPNFIGYYKVPFSKFNHIDYIFAKSANTLLYPNIIKIVNKYNKIGKRNKVNVKLLG